MIEDDPDSALLMSLHLSDACGGALRFSLETAETLAAGLELLQRREYSVVLLDLTLPDSRDLETLKRVRARAPDVPVVVLTNLLDERAAFEAVAEGASDFLIKERFEPSQLRRALGYAIERNRRADELRRLEKLRSEARERQRVESFKDRVLSTVAHELRSPMTIAKAAICNLLDGLAGALTEEQRQLLAIAQRNNERLARLIGNFLDLSRLESGQVKVAPESVDLAALAAELVDERRVAHGERLLLRVEPPASPALAWADRDLAAQLLGNLLDNACRHARSAVRVELQTGDAQVVARVRDDGPGVPADKARTLFQRFVQLDRPTGGAGYKGTGLGLAICQEIARLNEGRVWFEPGAGPGATFGFSLPRSKARAAAEKSHENESAQSPGRR